MKPLKEKTMHKNIEYKLSKHWYLGFLSIFGLSDAYHFFLGEMYSGWMLLWLLWLIDFIPTKKSGKAG
ncbi:MAG: hypothetical protein L3J88_03565 [Gammaproteobacteria bacterium]|nr:hypothetical protein [Gammaproteobacteria bacterium]MCF6362427.1 hypothetical protein [Gammaproteobacteria bacterium]